MVSLASLRPAGRATTTSKPSRPKLTVIDQRVMRSRAIRRIVYFGVCITIVAGLFAVALVQAQLVQGQQQLDELRRGLDDVEGERARLRRDVDIASSPEAIVGRANSLGMVRAADPVYFTALRSVNGQ